MDKQTEPTVAMSTPLPSGYRFIWFVTPIVAGAASLAGLVCRLMHWRVSVVLAVIAVAGCWVPLFFYSILSFAMMFKAVSILGAYFLLPTLFIVAIATVQSPLSARIGSILAARVAGIAVATPVMRTTTMVAEVSTIGSDARTPYTMLAMVRPPM
jgi:hypothetical protein